MTSKDYSDLSGSAKFDNYLIECGIGHRMLSQTNVTMLINSQVNNESLAFSMKMVNLLFLYQGQILLGKECMTLAVTRTMNLM
jgi:hypothetical protein